jgi:hypothetical protein
VVPFQVTDAGTVDYDPALDGYVSGRGSSTLVVVGVSVDIDATALSSSLFYVAGVTGGFDARSVAHVRLVPGRHVFATVASATVVFTVSGAGTVGFDAALDGFVSGRGSSTLVVQGVSVDVDATALSSSLFYVAGVTSAFASGSVQRLRLVPGRHVFATLAGAAVVFTVSGAGTVDFAPALDGFVSGRGSPTLIVRGYSIDIDATGTSYPSFLLTSVPGWLDARTVQHLRLVPGTYRVHFTGVPDALFRVTAAGTVDYDDGYAAVLSGKGSTTLTIRRAAPSSGVSVANSSGGWAPIQPIDMASTALLWLSALLGAGLVRRRAVIVA